MRLASIGVRALAALAVVFAAALAPPAHAQEKRCTDCHDTYAKKKFVHEALELGCRRCHSELDATKEPHVSKGKLPHGLGTASPAMCTTKCHEAADFTGKHVHAPVANGNCMACHDPHASDHVGLLRKSPVESCLECHPEVKQGPHVVAGFSRSGHPLGEPFKGKVADDPLRPGKPFYCVSCHEPHRSQQPRLVHVGAGMTSCTKCHKI